MLHLLLCNSTRLTVATSQVNESNMALSCEQFTASFPAPILVSALFIDPILGLCGAVYRPLVLYLSSKNCTLECANLDMWFESVAQLVEHRPFKALVLGSSPSALTIFFLQTLPVVSQTGLSGRSSLFGEGLSHAALKRCKRG